MRFFYVFLLLSFLFVSLSFSQALSQAPEVLKLKAPNEYPADDLSFRHPRNLEIINPLALKHYTSEQILAMDPLKVEQINWLYSSSFRFIVKGTEPVDVMEINNREFDKRVIIDYKDSRIELLSINEIDRYFKTRK